jgi:predicted dehydrogenase
MNPVRLGIAGLGGMGTAHARSILDGSVKNTVLSAVSDAQPERLEPFADAKKFADATEMFRSGAIDAVLIATPHYSHTTLGIAALEAGLHVLVEKPISVHKADAERLIAAHTGGKQVFAAMFNQRTDLYYQKLRGLVQSGELGRIQRINWIITNWFRPEAYYGSGGWRATWGGEGGGVLLNQCPHNIDLFQWMFGMPKSVRAFCGFGKYHNIEVEDEVTAYFEYAEGANAVFITSTGEAPGTNRLEITADRGRVVYENDSIKYTRNVVPTAEFSRTTREMFSSPEHWEVVIPAKGHGGQHREILNNFVAAIRDGAELIAPAREGIHSVELANAMLYSAFTDARVDLPLDGAAYEAHLKRLIAESKFVKRTEAGITSDLSKSFR